MKVEPRKYELVLILDPALSEATMKEEVSKVEQMISSFGGASVETTFMGKKETPYEIRKCKQGYFTLLAFESAESDCINQLTKQLRISETVMKFHCCRIGLPSKKFAAPRVRRGDSDVADVEIGFDS